MKGLIALALMMVAALMAAAQFLAPVAPLGRPGAEATAAPASPAALPAAGFSGDEIVLERDASGQFHLEGRVNGNRSRFLVDTGADMVALTVADAQAAGIDVNPNGFIPILRTASGEGWGTMITLDRLEIGDTELRNVGAVVVRDLGVSLLGQSVLGRMGRVELRGNRMVIEQKP